MKRQNEMAQLARLMGKLSVKIQSGQLTLDQLKWFLGLSLAERDVLLLPSVPKNQKCSLKKMKTLQVNGRRFVAYQLGADCQNIDLMAELGDKAEISKSDIQAITSEQHRGEKGFLLADYRANVFFSKYYRNKLEAVTIRWIKSSSYRDPCWSHSTKSINKLLRWPAGVQVIARA